MRHERHVRFLTRTWQDQVRFAHATGIRADDLDPAIETFRFFGPCGDTLAEHNLDAESFEPINDCLVHRDRIKRHQAFARVQQRDAFVRVHLFQIRCEFCSISTEP